MRRLRGCTPRKQTRWYFDPGGCRLVGRAHCFRERRSAPLLPRSLRVRRLFASLGLPPCESLRTDPLGRSARPVLPLQPLEPSPLCLRTGLYRPLRGIGLGLPLSRRLCCGIQGALWRVLGSHRDPCGPARPSAGTDPGVFRRCRDRPQSGGVVPHGGRRPRRRTRGASLRCGSHDVVRRSTLSWSRRS